MQFYMDEMICVGAAQWTARV